MSKPRTSVSALRAFQSCPRRYYWSQEQRIQPIQEALALRKGRAVHEARKALVEGNDWRPIIACIEDRRERLQAQAIMEVLEVEPNEYESVVAEVPFEVRLWRYGPIVRGKIDEVVVKDGEVGLVEFKVRTRRVQLGSIWEDLQTAVYMKALDRGVYTDGVQIGKPTYQLYQTVLHSNLAPEEGETDEEFAIRKGTMKCPDRAKQKRAETDEEYLVRIKATVVVETFRVERDERVIEDRIAEMQAWWAVIMQARRSKCFPQNSSACYGSFGNRTCPYYDLCASRNAPHILEGMYEPRPINEDFSQTENPVVE